MEMTASPAITTPRSRRWSSVSSSGSSSSFRVSSSGICESVRRPRSCNPQRDALRRVALGQLLMGSGESCFFIAIEKQVDLRKRAVALLTRFRDSLTANTLQQLLLDLGDDLLLRLSGCTLAFVVEFFLQKKRLA